MKEEKNTEKTPILEKIKTFGNMVVSLVTKNKVVSIILIVVIIALILFANIFMVRSARSTVKDIGKVAKNMDPIGAADLVDPYGMVAFYSCYDYKDGEMDFDDFDKNYDKVKEAEKKIKKELKKCKYKIKVTDTEKVSENKKLTKVSCDVELKYKSNTIKFKGIKIYTMRKGLKNYIVGIDPKSIEKMGEQLEDQQDDFEDMGEDLKEIVEDLEDLFDE